ncbi:ATP-binding protein [Alkaliphilus peptidifermentans]|uniref:Two-component system, sensor histidine kinase YcbA n=1 Tax=Alkaliphilus peptidifermentans DSM 18978 TaxID=1120976 RepID=A0A1G5CLP1_9FIRM|nr:ATP-binding protein [Alkaliphilus peptidifermentans]SCY03363.1 two-component system, sensor histidine kinase YcbA [Alkaliphilus peptidifermentans DSM 18978]
MIKINSKAKQMLTICFVTTFMGQIYLNPFSSDFRFSLSVVAFSLFIFWYKELSIIHTSFFTGVFLLIFRVFIEFLQNPSTSIIGDLVLVHYPVIIYYTFFGIFLSISGYRLLQEKKIMFIALLTMSDGLSNIVELLIRMESLHNFTVVFFVGFIRSFITILIIEVVKYYEMLLMKEQHEERYKQLVLITSNLKSEVFFLKKSMDDIENAMEKSYQLYQDIKIQNSDEKNELSFMALSIARDIHEIKKDYLRLTAGLENMLPEIGSHEGMLLEDIFSIIEPSFEKNIQLMKKDINIDYLCNENIMINNSYELISIINNLITNSIEAIPIKGIIIVKGEIVGQELVITVKDNGEGILPDNYSIVFEPGFTTKFDQGTGKMSSGIGLTHVTYLVVNQFKGKIELTKEKDHINSYTVFTIRIPMKNI